MNNIDIKNNFINQLKEKYKIIIGIILFILLMVIIIQIYNFYNNKKILDTSIVYNEIKSDVTNNEFINLLDEISKEKNFYGVLASIDKINLKLSSNELESAYQDYITLLTQSNLENLYKSTISIQASYNFLRLLSEESNMNKLPEFKEKITKLLFFVDPSIDSYIGFNLEILYLLSILEQDFSNSLTLSNESQNLYQQIQEGDRISAFIKERVKKINDFQKYK
ncbi:hypothetical protein OAJ30_02680 [Alphaproteobacteria bacterium]|nr:hypothetical protein [Alphaproteobacteria bacterium]